ncbi:MAG TPA: NAD(P)H-hydrate epimerase [Candidatus Dormibacteraeota bacterium]
MSSRALPTLTSRQVKELDALAQERFGISVDWLMEAVGWQLARFIDRPCAVVCGVGNNAGDGLAAARHLHRRGLLTHVSCVEAGRLHGAAAKELDALVRMGVEISTELRLEGADVILDAIFGTGLSRAPEGRFAGWIDAVNASGTSVVAVDVPSGLDADSGDAYSPTVNASTTITLGLPKPGLLVADGPRLGGEVLVADIGMPFEAYAAIGVDIPPDLFAAEDLVRLSSPQ